MHKMRRKTLYHQVTLMILIVLLVTGCKGDEEIIRYKYEENDTMPRVMVTLSSERGEKTVSISEEHAEEMLLDYRFLSNFDSLYIHADEEAGILSISNYDVLMDIEIDTLSDGRLVDMEKLSDVFGLQVEKEEKTIRITDPGFPLAEGPEKPVYLIWDYYRNTSAEYADNNITGAFGVVSPTWYELADGKGTLSSFVSENYLAVYREAGIEVWPLFSNSFDLELTHELLSSHINRRNYIANIVAEVNRYNLRGINMDFENVYLKDRDFYSVFLNELAYELRKMGVKLSACVTTYSDSENWSLSYDRYKIAGAVDYVMFMGYDEYWASSKTSGPVASLDWVKDSLDKLLSEIPKEKLVLGLPFYTRVWNERQSTTVPNQTNVKSATLTLKHIDAYLEEREPLIMKDEENGLYYTVFYEEEIMKKIWIENIETLSKKIDAAKEYDLAGVAVWRKGFENESVIEMMKNSREGWK